MYMHTHSPAAPIRAAGKGRGCGTGQGRGGVGLHGEWGWLPLLEFIPCVGLGSFIWAHSNAGADPRKPFSTAAAFLREREKMFPYPGESLAVASAVSGCNAILALLHLRELLTLGSDCL